MQPTDERDTESYLALTDVVARADRKIDAKALMESLFEEIGNVRTIIEMDKDELRTQQGMTRPACQAITMIDDIYRYMRREEFGPKPYLRRYETAAKYMQGLTYGRHVEYCYLLCLNSRGRLLRLTLLQKGTLDESVIYVREVAHAALLASAEYAVLAHNHPGGNPDPSRADVIATHRVMEALNAVDTILLDHIIVTCAQTTSVRKTGTPAEKIWLKQRENDTLIKRWFQPDGPNKMRR